MSDPAADTDEIMRLLGQLDGKTQAKVASRTVTTQPHPVERWQPKRLTPKHRQILSLYAQSVSRENVASMCKCTPALVTLLAKSDLGRAYLQEIEEAMDQRLRLLQHKVIETIEDQLDNGKGENKLKAAALQMRATGKLGAGDGDREDTAEDVIQRILNMQVNGDLNVQINNAPPAPIQRNIDAPDSDLP